MSIKNASIIVLFVVLLFSVSSTGAFASESSANSNDTLINKAVALTQTLNNSVVNVLQGQNSTGHPVKVQFANLSAISVDYINTDAVTLIGEDGHMTIYIDKSFQNSPPEAIACLLEHETTHSDSVSSISEEVIAWTKEATSWITFTRNNPTLAKMDENTFPLIGRLNYITELYKEAGNTSTGIRNEILSTGVYTNLALHSEGF